MTVTKDEPETLLGGTAIKPPERHGWEAIRYAIHDPDKGEFFGRTAKSWFLITVFYCIYYFLLACFWYGMLNLFFITIDVNSPKYQLEASIIGTNPGVGLRPTQASEDIDSSMLFLWAKAKNQRPSEAPFDTSRNVDWAKRYEAFVNKYDNTTETRDCAGDDFMEDGGDACRFSKADLGPCGEYPYGYELTGNEDKISPCVLLKINRIFNWKPTPYDADDLKYEDSIPQAIKDLAGRDPNKLYLNCEGENAADREALEGKVAYYPQNQAISYKYFPYTQANKNYHNPVVAVKFSDMPVGQLLHIECKLYAKGIEHSRKFRMGSVHFELFLNDVEPKTE